MDINPLVLYFLFTYCILLPLTIYRGYLKLKKSPPPKISRKQLYVRTILSLITLTILPLIVVNQVQGMNFFVTWHPQIMEICMGVALLIGWFIVRELLAPWMKKTAPQNRLLQMPLTWRQLALWACVSIAAGVCEEIIYRGVMFDCVVWYIHQPVLAAMICSACFAIAHIGQGSRSAWLIFMLALSLHGLVWVAGNLYMAMLVHATYDFAVGLRYVIVQQREDRDYIAAAA